MKRLPGIVIAVAASLVAVAWVGPPSVVKAVAGLLGRTHMIVTEQKLKVLTRFGDADVASLNEARRDGSVVATDYVVPAGRVFVVTDVIVSFGTCGLPIAQVEGAVHSEAGGPGPYSWKFARVYPDELVGSPRIVVVEDFHLTGGLAFDPGSKIQVTGGANAVTFDCGGFSGSYEFSEVTVIGYETEDTASLD